MSDIIVGVKKVFQINYVIQLIFWAQLSKV